MDLGMQRLRLLDNKGILLDERVIKKFKVMKHFQENAGLITSMTFSRDGELLVTSAQDDKIVIYDAELGLANAAIYCKKYGVDVIRFTRDRNIVIHGSTKVDSATVRCLSLPDNKYLRYFKGHTDMVTTLSMSPVDDSFLSGSLDKTLRLWDLRSPNCQGFMHVLDRPVASYDPDGLTFAVAIRAQHDCVKLYDLRSFDKGPFKTFDFPFESGNAWASLKFSPDGSKLMMSSFGSTIRIVDAFQGTPLQTFSGYANVDKLHIEAAFSPDSQFVFSGSCNGKIHVWNAEHGYQVGTLDGSHPHPWPVRCVEFNPKKMMIASACCEMHFWVPTFEEEGETL